MHHRVTAPFRVTLQGHTIDASDWSLGGFRIDDFDGPMPEKDKEYEVMCTLPFQGFNITFQAIVSIVRSDQKNRIIASTFVNLGDRETSLMRHFIEDLVRGSMTEVEDTIVRIDTPVTPVPTTPDPNPVEEIPVHRWPVKQITMTAFYLVLGTIVFGYVAIFAFATLFRLEVSTAVVSAVRTEVTSPVKGRIVSLPIAVGEMINAGQKLVQFEDTDLEAAQRDAATALIRTMSELVQAKRLLSEEQERARGYELVARNNIRQAEAQMESLELARKASQLKLDRYRALFKKGLTLRPDLDAAELEYTEAISALDRKRIHIEELYKLQEAGDSVRLYTGNAFAGRLAEMEAIVARLEMEHVHRQEILDELKDKAGQTALVAPYDGRVKVSKLMNGTAVRPGDPIMVIEETGAETVTAFLTQDEINQIRLGEKAQLYVPTEDRWVETRIEEIDRTIGFIDEITEMHRFRAPDSRSARVILSTTSQGLPQAGTPVTIYFDRYRPNTVLRTAVKWWRDL